MLGQERIQAPLRQPFQRRIHRLQRTVEHAVAELHGILMLQLLQLVADRVDLNKNKVKPVVEAMLEVLGEALAEGRELNLKPLGKVKINRQKEVGNARVTVAKIRQSKDDDTSGNG